MNSNTRGATLRRRLRSSGGKLIRRFGLLPGGIPDGLGDDDQLLGRPLDAQIVLHFADTVDGLYQLRQWYAPITKLSELHRVVVVCADSKTAAAIRRESTLDVVTVARYATLDDILARSDVKLALYVNHNPVNFSMLRFPSLVHVSLLHGDSDKIVSVSNQAKAYDFTFVAGQAAIDRMTRYLPLFDAAKRCIPIGRPQAEACDDVVPSKLGRRTVLYAPTWEGAQPSAAYGTLDTMGEEIVRSILSNDSLTLIYRPHPLTGVRVGQYGEADSQIRSIIADAVEREPDAGHRISTTGEITDDFRTADALLCDVSAVAMDWLSTTRPLVMTVPVSSDVRTAETPLSLAMRRIRSSEGSRAAEIIVSEIAEDPNRKERMNLIEYYLGDTSPGASMNTFLTAITETIRLRDVEIGLADGISRST